MPIIWTQIQFCEDVVDSIQKTQYYSQYEPFMKFGAQGTNLLYYYNLWSAQKRDNRISVNNQINNYELPLNMIKFAKNHSKQVSAFVFGFTTQFILERKVRPYLDYL